MYCGPQSHRMAKPRATSLPNWPKAWRTPWRIGSSAAQLRRVGNPADVADLVHDQHRKEGPDAGDTSDPAHALVPDAEAAHEPVALPDSAREALQARATRCRQLSLRQRQLDGLEPGRPA